MFGLFTKQPSQEALKVYETLVLQARQPHFFGSGRAPDTFEGRFELVVLHLWLFYWRTRDAGKDAQKKTEEVFQEFVEHLDRTYREIGVSDLKVPKRMEISASALYGRMSAYTDAIEIETDERQEAIRQVVSRNILGDGDEGEFSQHMTNYILACVDHLAGQKIDHILRGEIQFPAFEFRLEH